MAVNFYWHQKLLLRLKNLRHCLLYSALALSGCIKTLPDNGPKTQISVIPAFQKEILEQVSFVQPASGFSKETWEALKRSFPAAFPTPYVEQKHPYHTEEDTVRLRELENALQGDKKYIWARRGGYGSARLFEGLTKIGHYDKNKKKILIGYSDITFLHLLFGEWGWNTIHGAMPVDLLNTDLDNQNFALLEKMLSKKKGIVSYAVTPLNKEALAHPCITGKIIGGNLTIVATSLGTPWQIDGAGKIIFLEDVGSKGYVIDRDLNHLKQAGIFKEAAAIFFGSFTKGDSHVSHAIQRFANDTKIPVFYADIFGHGNKNYPLPFGFESRITKQSPDSLYTLTIEYDFR